MMRKLYKVLLGMNLTSLTSSTAAYASSYLKIIVLLIKLLNLLMKFNRWLLPDNQTTSLSSWLIYLPPSSLVHQMRAKKVIICCFIRTEKKKSRKILKMQQISDFWHIFIRSHFYWCWMLTWALNNNIMSYIYFGYIGTEPENIFCTLKATHTN